MSGINLHDIDPLETQEWIESLDSVLKEEGAERAHYLLEKLIDSARRKGGHLPYNATTAYLNTIATANQPQMPGDPHIERNIRSMIRWNAQTMVLRASKKRFRVRWSHRKLRVICNIV